MVDRSGVVLRLVLVLGVGLKGHANRRLQGILLAKAGVVLPVVDTVVLSGVVVSEVPGVDFPMVLVVVRTGVQVL